MTTARATLRHPMDTGTTDGGGSPTQPSTIALRIGVRLRAAREAAELSQKEVGERIGHSQAGIGNWERGLSMPGADDLVRLLDIYKVSCESILGTEESPATELAPLARKLVGCYLVDQRKFDRVMASKTVKDIEPLIDNDPPLVALAWRVPPGVEVMLDDRRLQAMFERIGAKAQKIAPRLAKRFQAKGEVDEDAD